MIAMSRKTATNRAVFASTYFSTMTMPLSA